MYKLISLCLFFALSCVAPQSQAWGTFGHKAVCHIAYKELTPQAKNRVDALLKHTEFESFGEACVWADLIRGDSHFDWAKPLHYLNVKRGTKHIDPETVCPKWGCVYSAIADQSDKLKGEKDPQQAAQALMFLGHFVGDLHQPLHAGFADDKGGNSTEVKFFDEDKRLHSVWDSGIIYKIWPKQNWRSAANNMRKAVPEAQKQKWQQSNVETWANESVSLAASLYTDIDKPMQQGYVDKHKDTIVLRIQQAGIRLGNLLNQLLAQQK